MPKFVVEQSLHLEGEIEISCAKNATLPILCASLLSSHDLIIDNVPSISDVDDIIKLLRNSGVKIKYKKNRAVCNGATLSLNWNKPQNIEAKNIRASVMLLGPLLSRFGFAQVPWPGGCAIGRRPIDQHIKGLEAMGGRVTIEDGYITATANGTLHGALIEMDIVSVCGTENLVLAAVLAQGTLIIKNAAKEPEVADLCHCLNKMGAKIEGIGTDTLVIHGVDHLHKACHTIIPDRCEAGTFAAAAAITASDLTLVNIQPLVMESVFRKLRKAGAVVIVGENYARIVMDSQPSSVDIETAPYPGFATDLQAPFMVLNSVANGTSFVTENIFENRFQHVSELRKMGADIDVIGNTAKVCGVNELHGVQIRATDLRAGASLVLAGMVAKGRTVIEQVDCIDRGYDKFELKLNNVGAKIVRVD